MLTNHSTMAGSSWEKNALVFVSNAYDSKTFAIQIDGKWFGITYAFITHSRYESKPFDQKMTPYTEDGRRRYVNYRTKHKPLPCDRPSINTPEDIALSIYASGKGWKANFEYFMNREYAYNRDKVQFTRDYTG